MDCVCLHTSDLEQSLAFYPEMGLREAWRLERTTEEGIPWTLVGLDFPDNTSSQLTLSTHTAQSARRCDFGQVEERCGNMVVVVDG